MDKIINISARVLSALAFPILMPAYAILLAFTQTYLRLLPGNTLITVLLVTIGVTIMIPVIAIYVLHTTGRITDPLLNNRQDRTIPFALTAL